MFDYELLLSNDQDPSSAGTTVVSENAIDLEAAPPRQIGDGEKITVTGIVTTAITGGTSMQFRLVESAAAALTTPTILAQTASIVVASLVAGYQFVLQVPIKILALQFLGLIYASTGTTTAGAVFAGIRTDNQTAGEGWPANDGF